MFENEILTKSTLSVSYQFRVALNSFQLTEKIFKLVIARQQVGKGQASIIKNIKKIAVNHEVLYF